MSYSELVRRSVSSADAGIGAEELEQLSFDQWTDLYAENVRSATKDQGAELDASDPLVYQALDVLLAQALQSELDSAPILNANTIARDSDNAVLAEFLAAIAALLMTKEALMDPTERVEADSAFFIAGELAIANGHPLTAVASAQQCSDVDDRERLLARIRRRFDT